MFTTFQNMAKIDLGKDSESGKRGADISGGDGGVLHARPLHRDPRGYGPSHWQCSG